MATYKDMLLDIIQPTTERQYGGGLDDAYMNRRSAFASPNANSAFASPMSQGGLPTIYRQEGGNFSVQGGIKNYMNNNTGQIVDNVPEKWKSSPSHPETLLSYITKDEANLLKRANIHNSPKSKPPGSGVGPSGIPSFNGYGEQDADYSGGTGGTEGDAEGAASAGNAGGSDDGTYNLGQLEALDRAYDPSPEPEDSKGNYIKSGPDEELISIRAAMNAGRARDAEDRASGYLSPDTTYRTSGRGGNVSEIRAGWEKFGTPEIAERYIRNLEGKYGRDEATTRVAAALASPGGVQALESGTGTGDTIAGLIDAIQESDDLGRQRQRSYEGIKEERSLKDILKSLVPFGVKVDPRIEKANEEYAKRQGGIQTPEGFFSKAARGLAGAIAPPIGMFQTGLALAGKSPAGTFSIDGLDFNVTEDGTSSFNNQAMFDDNIDYGNDAPDKKP